SGAQYVYRACGKTSPFSTLGMVIPGLWIEPEACPSASRSIDLPDSRRGHVRLNVALLARLLGKLTYRAIACGTARVALNPTLHTARERAHFVRRRTHALQSVATIDALVAHTSFSLPLSPCLESVIAALESGESTVARLASLLANDHAQPLDSARDY